MQVRPFFLVRESSLAEVAEGEEAEEAEEEEEEEEEDDEAGRQVTAHKKLLASASAFCLPAVKPPYEYPNSSLL